MMKLKRCGGLLLWLFHLMSSVMSGISTGPETVLFSCDFETDFCDMVQLTYGDFNWTRHSGPTPTPDTGPSSAYGGSYYMYMEATDHLFQDAGIAISSLEYQGIVCMSFAYHMYGAHTESLFTRTKQRNGPGWYKYGDQGNHWREAVAEFDLPAGDSLDFQGSVGTDTKGDIAVDDVIVRTGSCKRQVDLPYFCSFESGFCGMTQTNDDNFDWMREDRQTGSSDTGPSQAYDGSWFLYIDTSDQRLGNGFWAGMETPAFSHTGPVCVRFHYHMFGTQDRTLIAKLQNNETVRRIFEAGIQGNQWFSAEITVADFQQGNWILFDGRRGYSPSGDIAIDQVFISTDECNACQVNNGDCQHTCHKTTQGGRICTCDDGFQLSGDSDTACIDMDECAINNGNCSHHCSNTNGTFTCLCDSGYTLAPDGRNCTEADGEHSTEEKEEEQEMRDPVTAIAGGTAAAAAVIIIAIVIVILLLRRRKLRQTDGREIESYASVSAAGPRPRLQTLDAKGSDATVKSVDPEDGLEEPSALYAVVKRKSERTSKFSLARAAKGILSKKEKNVANEAENIPQETRNDGLASGSQDSDKSASQDGDKLPGSPEAPGVSPNSEGEDNHYYNMLSLNPRTTEEFLKHIKNLRKGKGFEKEYKRLPSGQILPWDDALREGIKVKNRFKNIYPYDQNRVHLNIKSDDPTTDYINASQISGYDAEDTFIASHGPTDFTKSDFWRMIWEKDITVVVMVTNLIENGNLRCHKYWPDKDEDRKYDDVTVNLVTETRLPDLTIRTFRVCKGSEERAVEQFHYTSWPDYGVPDDATTMLRFHKRVRQSMQKGVPTLVHCSAGVGRTGTFIAIDYLLKQAEKEGKVDVYNCVTKLRQQRIHMIQTQKQYVFIHDALLEALMIGDTTISCDTFHKHVQRSVDAIERQFEIMKELQPTYTEDDRSRALSDENKDKNVDPGIIPRVDKRVFLTSHTEGRNDYINAVFIHSYQKKNAFIATQLPLEETMLDFWRMIHDLRCDTVVLMGHSILEMVDIEGEGKHMIGNYQISTKPLSQSGEDSFQRTSVTVQKEKEQATYENVQTISDMQEQEQPVGASRDAVSCTVVDVPVSSLADLTAPTMTRLYAVVQDGRRQGDTFVVFVCRDGARLSGVAVACFSMFEMMSHNNNVDIFHIAKQVKNSRPEFLSTLEEYKHLHDLAGDYIKQYGTYANFR